MLVCGGDDARVNLFIYKEGKVSDASLTLFALTSSIFDNCPLGSHLSHSDSRIPRDVFKIQYRMGCIMYLVYHVVHWDPMVRMSHTPRSRASPSPTRPFHPICIYHVVHWDPMVCSTHHILESAQVPPVHLIPEPNIS